jgi:hypothetical protein
MWALLSSAFCYAPWLPLNSSGGLPPGYIELAAALVASWHVGDSCPARPAIRVGGCRADHPMPYAPRGTWRSA